LPKIRAAARDSRRLEVPRARVITSEEPVNDRRVEMRAATATNKKTREDVHSAMTATQYLKSQAEHCRRAAEDAADPFVADELRRLAAEFERRARAEIRAAAPAPENRAA
jgi:hypothetical protein